MAATALLCVLAGSSAAASGSTTRVSVNSSGAQGNGFSSQSDMSANGDYVAFASTSSNLVPSDTNGVADVFVHDRLTGKTHRVTERVSVDAASGTETVIEANGDSSDTSISANGRYVAFLSAAYNLDPDVDDTNGLRDVFVHDRDTDGNGIFDEPGKTDTKIVSVDDSGAAANGESREAVDVSSNGRVAFISEASNLVSNDTNTIWDFFVHDLNTHDTERVNVDESGNQVKGGGIVDISISPNGRYVGFATSAPYLVPDDPGDVTDGFVRDLDPEVGQSRTIWRVAYSAYSAPYISDGGLVGFASYAPNLVPNDTNGVSDVFVRDLPDGQIQRVSVDSSGKQANDRSFWAPSISSNGRYVAFDSFASNLVPNDTNGRRDVFVRDLQAQTTEQVSVPRCAAQANGHSSFPTISTGGHYVAFESGASNLVANDTFGSDVFVRDRLTEPDSLPSECIAPTSTASATTSSGADYTSGTWTNQEVTLTFSAQDNEDGLGVKDVRYSATGADATLQQTVPADDLPATFTIDAEGTTTVRYLATDKEGNVESPAKTFTVKIDKSPPTVESVYPADAATGVAPWDYVEAYFTEPMDPDTLTPSTFTLTKQGTSTPIEATVDYESYESSNVALLWPSSNLASNTTYTATIKGGSSGAKALSGYPLELDYSWTFTTAADTTVPDTTIDSGPSGTVSSTTASFGFSSNESGSTFKCRLDSTSESAWSDCSSAQDYDGLSEGTHTFEVKATDTSGNTDPTPASRTWTVDASPDTTILSGPSDYVSSTSASFSFSSSEPGSTFQCSRDGASFTACSSPKSYSSLSQGNHTFRVRAVDKAGNVDASPASRSWFVDTVAPKGTIAINGKDISTRSQTVTLSLSASDPSPVSGVALMRFKNENTTTWSDWLPYSGTHSWTLSNGAGTKTVYVQFKDKVDNVSATAYDKIKYSP